MPVIVFVLYTDFETANGTELFEIERGRFRGYYNLDKLTPTSQFRSAVERTISLCQADLSFNLTQEKITSLKKELARIQRGASDESVSVPLKILEDLQEQLKAREEERAGASRLGRSDIQSSHVMADAR